MNYEKNLLTRLAIDYEETYRGEYEGTKGMIYDYPKVLVEALKYLGLDHEQDMRHHQGSP